MSKPMMKCGHAANATHNGKPSCVICAGITPDSDIIDPNGPNLEGRMAKCYCGRMEPSSTNLAFFEYKGEGSERAQRQCKHCNYFKEAHTEKAMHNNSILKCTNFEPHGEFDFDDFYCGCRGWD